MGTLISAYFFACLCGYCPHPRRHMYVATNHSIRPFLAVVKDLEYCRVRTPPCFFFCRIEVVPCLYTVMQLNGTLNLLVFSEGWQGLDVGTLCSAQKGGEVVLEIAVLCG